MGVLLGLFSGITYGAADFIGGLASRRSSTLSVVAISQLAGLIVVLAIMPLLPRAVAAQHDLLFGALAGLCGAVGIAFLYRGLAVGRMSVVSPLTAVIAAIVPVGVGLAFGERPAAMAIVGVLLALVAVVLVSAVQSPSHGAPAASENATTALLQPGVLEALLSGVAIGGFLVLLARTHANAGLWPLASARCASVVAISATAMLTRQTLRPAQGDLVKILAAGLLDMSANACYLVATRFGLLSIVAVLASLYPASTVMLARVLLHERLAKIQIAGVACALLAIALIAAGSKGT